MIKTYAYKDIKIDEIFAREEEKTTVADVVAEIIADVRKQKDAAVLEYCRRFDRVELNALEVTKEEIAEAKSQVTPEFLRILQKPPLLWNYL